MVPKQIAMTIAVKFVVIFIIPNDRNKMRLKFIIYNQFMFETKREITKIPNQRKIQNEKFLIQWQKGLNHIRQYKT